MRAPQGRGADLGQAEMAHLTGGHEFGHRADRFLDRHARVEPVQIVQIDRFDTETAQAALAGLAHVRR